MLMRPRLRPRAGSTITETGPMIFVFFIVIFFPLLNLLFLGVDFCGAWYLNHLVTRELALTRQAQWNGAIRRVDDNFRANGLGQFLKITNSRHSGVRVSGVRSERLRVRCTSNVTCDPFLNIPLPVQAPGLNQPVTFTFTSDRPSEEIR